MANYYDKYGDISATITNPNTPDWMKAELAIIRQQKENDMKAEGTWDPDWKTTSELYSPPPKNTSLSSGNQTSTSGFLTSQQNKANNLLTNQKNSQKASVEAQVKNLQQQAYLQKVKELGNLNKINALKGQTGGLAESTMLAPTAAYRNTLNEIGANQMEANRQIDQAADAQELQLAINFADKALNQMNLENQMKNQNEWNQKNWDFSQTQYEASRVDSALNLVMNLIAGGARPTDEQLQAANLTREQADAIAQQLNRNY